MRVRIALSLTCEREESAGNTVVVFNCVNNAPKSTFFLEGDNAGNMETQKDATNRQQQAQRFEADHHSDGRRVCPRTRAAMSVCSSCKIGRDTVLPNHQPDLFLRFTKE